MKKLSTNALVAIEGGGNCPDGFHGGRVIKVAAFLCIDGFGWGWCNLTSETQLVQLCQNSNGDIVAVLLK